jgi:hypothetical protein
VITCEEFQAIRGGCFLGNTSAERTAGLEHLEKCAACRQEITEKANENITILGLTPEEVQQVQALAHWIRVRDKMNSES